MFSSKWFRFLIVITVVALACLLAVAVDRLERARTQAIFESYTDDSQQALINRIDGYVRTLDGAAALFAASDFVTALDWRRYVDTIDIENRLPGILGVGYIASIDASAGLDAATQSLQQGLELPPIHPDTGRDEKYVIQFIEPLESNQAALGLDIAFEDGRRLAAQRARDTNSVQLTPPIELVQDNDHKVGFLLLRPLYNFEVGLPPSSGVEAEFGGWVYVPFVGESLFLTLTPQQGRVATLHVHDGDTTDIAASVFGDHMDLLSREPQFRMTREIDVFGRNWTLVWNSTPAFEQANTSIGKWIVIGLGLALSALLALMLRIISQREKRVAEDVATKTKELRAKNEETQSIIDNAVLSIFVLDEDDRIISTNEAAKALFGDGNINVGDPIDKIISISEGQPACHRTARPARAPNAPDLHLVAEVNSWNTADGRVRKTLLVQDVSVVEEGARKLQENEARWNLALAGAQIGVFDIDLTTGVSVVSDTWRKLMDVPLETTALEAQELFFSRIHPDDVQNLREADKECIEGRADHSVAEYRMNSP